MINSRQNSSMYSTTSTASQSLFRIPSFLQIKRRKHLFISVCTGNLLALSVGLTFAWSSPMLPKLVDKDNLKTNPIHRVITSEEASWIGSFMAFGAMFGTFFAGFIAAKCGRKIGFLIGCAVPFIIANVIILFADTVYIFYVARIIAGLAVSGVYTVVPMYLAEIAEDSIRGLICSSMLTFETLGELVTYCAGPYVTIRMFSQITIATTVVVAILVLFLLPESPYYFLSVNNQEGAEKSLMILRNSTKEGIKTELESIQSIMQKTEGEKGKILDLFKTKASIKAEITTLTLTFCQHFSGIVPILFYAQGIFNETGSSIPPEYCSMIFGVVQFLSSFVAPTFVDKLGRRCLLLMSAFGMLLADFFLGLYFFMKESRHDTSMFFWLPVLCLVTYIFSYISGFGPLIWTIMGEIFPTHLKAPAFTVGVWFWWTMAFTLSRVFYPISLAIGMVGAFWIFAADCFIAILFICFYVIETKGKSFQEIQEILNK